MDIPPCFSHTGRVLIPIIKCREDETDGDEINVDWNQLY